MTDRSQHAVSAGRGTKPTDRSLNLAIPRIVQSITSDSSSGYSSNIETMSHEHTVADSEQQGRNSLYSYNSTRDVSQFVREIYGRTYNSLSDRYFLPTDEAEWQRLDKQHSALVTAMNGLTPCQDIMNAVLAVTQEDTEPKRVLDIGCGTGSWAMEMAIRYPHAIVKGVDLAPVPLDAATFPPNLQFEIDDVNQGLTHFYDQYDVVHARCVRIGIKDYAKTMREAQLCLKPGGLIVIIDGDTELRGEDIKTRAKMKMLEGDEDVDGVSERGSWFQRVLFETNRAATLAGSDHNPSAELIDHGLWDQPICDPNTAVAGSLYLPIGPWVHSDDQDDEQALKYVGLLMRQVFLNIHWAYQVRLRRHGVTQETLDEWAREVEHELKNMTIHMWVRFRFCWARRRIADNQPAPLLPALPTHINEAPTMETSNALSRIPTLISESVDRPHRYPGFETYQTREEAIQARLKRREMIKKYPLAFVDRLQVAQSNSA